MTNFSLLLEFVFPSSLLSVLVATRSTASTLLDVSLARLRCRVLSVQTQKEPPPISFAESLNSASSRERPPPVEAGSSAADSRCLTGVPVPVCCRRVLGQSAGPRYLCLRVAPMPVAVACWTIGVEGRLWSGDVGTRPPKGLAGVSSRSSSGSTRHWRKLSEKLLLVMPWPRLAMYGCLWCCFPARRVPRGPSMTGRAVSPCLVSVWDGSQALLMSCMAAGRLAFGAMRFRGAGASW